MTGKCVLDSSVIIKAFIEPNPSLSPDVYAREISTHQKCIQVMQYIQESGIEICIPKICVLEVAAVISRFTDHQKSHLIAYRTFSTCTIFHEEHIFNEAWKIAEMQGCSGFDTYFIALAYSCKIPLFTDDSGMHYHAQKKKVHSCLIRESDLSTILKYIS